MAEEPTRQAPAGAGRLRALRAALPAHRRVLIVPHDYPDPDALASAAAVHLLLDRAFGVRSRIVFTGMVARAENRELLRHFRYRWQLLEHARLPKRRPQPAIFVDCRPWSGNVTVPAMARPTAVIDHHPGHLPKNRRIAFEDIRPGTGASATILYGYLREADIAVPTWLATCMAYAISTETMDFSRPFTPEDLNAYIKLLSRSNMRTLGAIRNAPLPASYFAELQEAIVNARVYGRTAWSHLSAPGQPEIVPEIADRLVQIERITWSFCTAFHEGKLIVSLRSNRKEANCGSLLRAVFPRAGSAGGHDRMAAGQVDLGGQAPAEREKTRRHLVQRLVSRIDKRAAKAAESVEELSRSLVRAAPAHGAPPPEPARPPPVSGPPGERA